MLETVCVHFTKEGLKLKLKGGTFVRCGRGLKKDYLVTPEEMLKRKGGAWLVEAYQLEMDTMPETEEDEKDRMPDTEEDEMDRMSDTEEDEMDRMSNTEEDVMDTMSDTEEDEMDTMPGYDV